MSDITKINDNINTQVSGSNKSYTLLDTMLKDNDIISEDHYMLAIKLLKEKIDELVVEVNKLKG
tara:strand:- start:727 stop:918 length:192 start_codon:yes stop_codon:yes gene_type:complete